MMLNNWVFIAIIVVLFWWNHTNQIKWTSSSSSLYSIQRDQNLYTGYTTSEGDNVKAGSISSSLYIMEYTVKPFIQSPFI